MKTLGVYSRVQATLIGPIKRPRFLLKSLLFSSFILICLCQCWTILANFFEYPKIINMYDVSPSLVTILPGLTICNNNRVSLRKLAQRNETIRRRLQAKFPDWQLDKPRSLAERSEFNKFRDQVSQVFDQIGYNPSLESEQTTMDKSFDVRPDSEPFIEWLGCARTWTDSLDCGQLTRIDSITNRHCNTVLHRGAMLNDLLHRPHLFDSSRSTPSEALSSELGHWLRDFDAKEVIKIVLNFEPEDYADLRRQIGARITFHDSNFVAASGDLDFFLTRGFRYDFNIDRRDKKLLKEPYDECHEYDHNLKRYEQRIDTRVPLSSSTCFQNCIVRNVLHRSKCWPVAMPYFRNDSLDPDLKVKPCHWFHGSQNRRIFEELVRKEKALERLRNNASSASAAPQQAKSRPSNERMKTYQKIRRYCWSQCVLSCRLTEYSVTLTRSAWPTDVNMMLDKTGLARHRRHCCALIAIKYAHYHYNVHEYQPKYDVANTIGDIGGLLAVWLGLSIVSVYRALNKLVSFFGARSMDWLANIAARGVPRLHLRRRTRRICVFN